MHRRPASELAHCRAPPPVAAMRAQSQALFETRASSAFRSPRVWRHTPRQTTARAEKLASEQSVALTTGIAEINAQLRVRDFADRAAILRRNTDAVVALFDDTRFVNQEGTIFLAERRADQQLMLGNNRLNRPSALADKVLQGADRHPQMQGHGLNRFAFAPAEQAVQIRLSPAGLFGTRKDRDEVGVIGSKLIEQASNISGRQIAFGRWARVEYNIHGYGVPFTDRFVGVRERIPYPFW